MNYKKQYLLERLKTKLQFAYDNYGKENILGIFLYGSQNYNCETETSDVDAKVIYVPCLMEAIINKSRLVKTHIFENGEHLEIIDIRELVENYKKQNKKREYGNQPIKQICLARGNHPPGKEKGWHHPEGNPKQMVGL